MRVNLFQQTAQFYDLVISRGYVEADIPFYKKIIQPQSRILEVGCGTGRVAIELAELVVKTDSVEKQLAHR